MNKPLNFPPFIIGTMRLGSWGAKFSTKEYERFIEQCIELGLTHFDLADIYGHYTTEAEFGAVLKKRPDLNAKVQLTSKSGIRLVSKNRPNHRLKSYDSSKDHILASVDHSLQALGRSHLDVFLLHRPDYLMNPHEIASAFEQLKKSGKVRAFGVSNFSPSQFDLLNSYTPLISHQVEISILQLNAFTNGTLDQCLKYKIQPTAWSPFGGGAIFSKDTSDQLVRLKTVANRLAEKYNTNLNQILLAFLRVHPSGIIPILGSTKIVRIETALQNLSLEITKEEWYELWQASTEEEIA